MSELEEAIARSKARHPASQDPTIWYAKLTQSMLESLTEEDRDALIEELDEAVANICEHYGV